MTVTLNLGDDTAQLEKALESRRVMVLATAGEAGMHCTPLFFVPNNGGRSLLLGISYGKSNSSDEIMHSNKIVLLDREGAVKAEVEGLAGETDSLADAAS